MTQRGTPKAQPPLRAGNRHIFKRIFMTRDPEPHLRRGSEDTVSPGASRDAARVKPAAAIDPEGAIAWADRCAHSRIDNVGWRSTCAAPMTLASPEKMTGADPGETMVP